MYYVLQFCVNANPFQPETIVWLDIYCSVKMLINASVFLGEKNKRCLPQIWKMK